MRFSLFMTLTLFFLLSACASTTAYQQQLKQWQGKNICRLQNKWGQPDASIKLANGHVLYQYTRKTFYTIPDQKRRPLQTNSSIFANYDDPWLSTQTLVRYCRTTFETNANGSIIHISFKGNNCLAYRFTQ